MSGCRAPPRRRALAEGSGWRPCCSRYSRCCARWELHLPTLLTSCCAVARPHAVRAREESLQGAQYRLVAGSCSAAARLRPPVAGRPARTEAGFGRPCRPRVCCSRSERGWSLARAASGEGLLSSTTTASLGRARRARSTRRSSPLSPAALAQRCALPPHLYYCAAVFGPAATPRGQRARRARGRGSPTATGLACPRWQHLPEACLSSAPLVPLAEACAPPLARVGPGPRARARREPLFSVRTRRASPM